MRTFALAFFLGTLLFPLLPILPPFWLCSVIFLFALFASIFTLWLKSLVGFNGQLITATLLGFSWTLMYSHLLIFSTSLPAELENKSLVVTGIITSIPLHNAKGINFEFLTTQLNRLDTTASMTQKLQLTLSWYGKVPKLAIGEQWRLYVKLKRPRGLANPGSFNYERWLLQKKIHATGYVIPTAASLQLAPATFSWSFGQFRQTLNEKIRQQLGDDNTGGLIRALILGIRDGMTPAQWQFFQATGTSHLMAISGLHIGLMASFCFFAMQWLWRRSARLCLYYPAPQVAAGTAILGAFIYAALAGFSIPTQRALVMVIVFMSTFWLRTVLMPWTSLCLALWIILLLDPLASLSAGFWLSFAAVAVILYSTKYRITTKQQWKNNQRIHWAIFIGLFPLTLWLFQQNSLISIPANLIAIPWVSFLVVPLSLLGSALILLPAWLPLGKYCLVLATYLMQLLVWPLHWMATLPFSQWNYPLNQVWHMIAFSLGALLLIAPKGWPGRWLGILGILPLITFSPPSPKFGEAWLTVLDVGQGLAVILRTQHHTLLYDTGPPFGSYSDAGNRVIIPYLRQQNIQHIDTVIISHPDSDHRGGLTSILQLLSVATLYVNAKHPIAKEYYRFTKHCIAGQQWQWDGVQFTMLHPPLDFAGSKGNDHCCVLKITVGNKSILLVGDIEKSAEKYLIITHDKQLKADILIAPHHGSKTSSSASFIEAISPQYVIFSTGYLNRYRFPNAQVVSRYQALQTTLLNTAYSGAVNFVLSPQENLQAPRQFRQEQSRLWQTLLP